MANYFIRLWKAGKGDRFIQKKDDSPFNYFKINIPIVLGKHGIHGVSENIDGDFSFGEVSPDSFLLMEGYLSGLGSGPEVPFLDAKACQDGEGSKFLQKIKEKDFENFSGSFSFIKIDFKLKELTLITDRLSSRPIWFMFNNDSVFISNNPNLIVFYLNKIEYRLGGLASFLLYGSPSEPAKSVYMNIQGVPPGTIIKIKSQKLVSCSEWYRFVHKPDESLNEDDWAEFGVQEIIKAAERILKTTKKPIIFLSGGVDSRLAATGIKAGGGCPFFLTLCDQENYETWVARKVAESLGCFQRMVHRDPYWYLRSLPMSVVNSGGAFEWTHGHFLQAYREIKEFYPTDGALLGDFFEAFSKLCCDLGKKRKKIWAPHEFLHEYNSLLLPGYRPLNGEATLGLLKTNTRKIMIEELNEDIKRRYQRLSSASDDPKIIADLFFRWHSAATIATFLMILDLRSGGKERSLMFEKNLHELLQVLPSKIRGRGDFGAELIKRIWPRAADIPNSNTHLSLNWPRFAHNTALKIKPVLGRVKRKILTDTYRTTGSWPKKSVLYLNDERWRTCFGKILCDASLYDETIFDFENIKKCWEMFLGGDIRLYKDIEKLVQIGLFIHIIRGNFENIEELLN